MPAQTELLQLTEKLYKRLIQSGFAKLAPPIPVWFEYYYELPVYLRTDLIAVIGVFDSNCYKLSHRIHNNTIERTRDFTSIDDLFEYMLQFFILKDAGAADKIPSRHYPDAELL